MTAKKLDESVKQKMKEAGIELADMQGISCGCMYVTKMVFNCLNCGYSWTVDYLSGKMPKGWWKCPQGCNQEKEISEG